MKEPVKLSLFYFLMYSAFASWLAFFNIHLEKLGFTGLQIGSFNSIYIMMSAVVVPLWGLVADRRGSFRTLLLLSAMCAMIVMLLSRSKSYYSITITVLAISLFQQPIGAVIDGMVISLVRTRTDLSYGKLRLWGSAGWGITCLVVGYFAMENTLMIFYIASAIFSLLFLVNLLTLPPKPLIGRGLVTYKSLGIFFRNSKLYIFLFLILLYGISIAPLHLLINLYYSEIGAPNSLMGIAFIIQAGCEIPFFLFGARMVKKTGAEFIILLAMLVSMLRMVLYGFISIPSIAIFVGILHGFTISFFLIGAVEYVQSQTPSHLRTTGQSLIWAFHFGAGLTVGYTVVGYLKDVIGMRHAMHISALFSLIIVVITYMFFKKHSNFRIMAIKAY